MRYKKLGEIISIHKGKKLDDLVNDTPDSIRYIQIEDLRDDSNLKFMKMTF